MMQKVTRSIRPRSGNGWPPTVSGMESAAASETTPRMPVKPTMKGLLPGRRRPLHAPAPVEDARDGGGEHHPEEARDDDDDRGDGDCQRQAPPLRGVQPVGDDARLQAGEQEDDAFDEVDQHVPYEEALQPRGGGDETRAVPAHPEASDDGCKHARAAQRVRHPEGDEGGEKGDDDFDMRIADPAAHTQRAPARGDPPGEFAGNDGCETA